MKSFADDAAGTKVGVRFADWLPSESRRAFAHLTRRDMVMPSLEAIQRRRIAQSMAPEFEPLVDHLEPQLASALWGLGDDWEFDRIFRDVKTDPRALDEGPVTPPAERLFDAMLALERATFKIHPGLTVEQAQVFWQSREVLDFLEAQRRWWMGWPRKVRMRVLSEGADHDLEALRAQYAVRRYLSLYIRKLQTEANEPAGSSLTTAQRDSRRSQGKEAGVAEDSALAAVPNRAGRQPADLICSAPEANIEKRRTTEQKLAVDMYRQKVLEATSVRIFDSQIWRAAGFTDSTQFLKWRNGQLTEHTQAARRLRKVLKQEPHLKDPLLGRKS
jgi:hypothetical protein